MLNFSTNIRKIGLLILFVGLVRFHFLPPRWLFPKTSTFSMSMSSNQRDGNTIKFSFKLNNQTLLHRWLYSRVSNRRDFPLINYSVFCHPPQPWSALPVYYFWRILPASPFISDSPFINSCVQSTAVAWSLGKAAKLFDAHVFFNKHDVYKHIQGQVWKWFFI